jgi:DNA-directed RNA polymerase subunit F
MIAVQLTAFRVESKLCLNFVKVLDVTEEPGDEESEPVTRKDWEDYANEASLQIMDKMISLIPRDGGEVRVKYNQGHIAVGTSGTNFCWFHPRKSSRIHVHLWLGEDRDSFVKKFKGESLDIRPRDSESIALSLTMKDFEVNEEAIKELLEASERRSR